MDNFIKEGLVNDSGIYEEKSNDNERDDNIAKLKSSNVSEDFNNVFNFDNDLVKNFNFSFSNNFEHDEVFINPKDIFANSNTTHATDLKVKKNISESYLFNHSHPMMSQSNLDNLPKNFFPCKSNENKFNNNMCSRPIDAKVKINYNENYKIRHSKENIHHNENIKATHMKSRITNLKAPLGVQPYQQAYYQKKIIDQKIPSFLIHKNSLPPVLHSFNENSVAYSNTFRLSHCPPTKYYQQYPISKAFTSFSRINPTNNSLFNCNQRFKSPQGYKILKRPLKKIIRLAVDGKALYKFKIININSNFPYKHTGYCEQTFLSSVNVFNESLGIMKVPFKYGTVLSFIFFELKKFNGYFNTHVSVWNQLSQVIKHFSWINQIYLFLVYPFEQFTAGCKKIRVFEDEKVFKIFKADFSKVNTTDIDICLSKDKLSDIEFMINNIDPGVIKIEGVIILLNFFVDIFQVKFENFVKDKLPFIKQMETTHDRYNFEERSLFEKLRKTFLSKLGELDVEKSIILVKRCIEISIEHGKICKKKYLGFNIDQVFLNKIFNLLVILKENNYLDIELILDFINVCGKSYFFENLFIFKYCCKLCKTDPVFTLEILSNVKFSRVHNKKLLKELRKFIIPKIDDFNKLFLEHGMLDDNKLLENIIRSFVCVKSMKNRFKTIFKSILLHCDYIYKHKLFTKKRNSSDLFKIILVMIAHEDVKAILYSDLSLLRRLKNIPGIRDII